VSESRRKFVPKLFLLTEDQAAFIVAEAERRDAARYGVRRVTRLQNSVARDVVEFARKNYPLFLTFVATDSHSATAGNTEQTEAI